MRAEAGGLGNISNPTQKITGALSNVLINDFPKEMILLVMKCVTLIELN